MLIKPQCGTGWGTMVEWNGMNCSGIIELNELE